MKYLITGITGFAGPNLAKLLLKENHEVHGLIRCSNGRQTDLLDILSLIEYNAIKFITCDLKHFYKIDKIIKENKYDGVFHLAAQSHPPTSFDDPILTFNENVMGSINLITAIQGTNTKLMFCSTSEVYGNSCKDSGLLKITDKLCPNNPYGSSKAAIDLYMQERMNNGFINGFITRAFSHTGPRRGFNFSISSDAFQIAKMKLGLQDKVLNVGNLNTKRVVIDVRDCINAYYKLMLEPKSNKGIFNICGKDVHKMEHYTNLLIKSANFNICEIEKRIDPKLYRKIDIQVQIGDSTEIENLVNWKPIILIENTMSDLLEYWIKKIKAGI